MIVKHFVYAVVFMATILFSSCEKVIEDGAWDPIELDKSHVHFPQEGGQSTVSALNYNRWWINGGYEPAAQADKPDNQWEYANYIHATSSGGEETYTYDVLDGGWYHVLVPDKGKSNTIIITVEPNHDAKPRQAFIDMQAGDAFTQISISQQ